MAPGGRPLVLRKWEGGVQVGVTCLYLFLLLCGGFFPKIVEHFLYFLFVIVAAYMSESKLKFTRYVYLMLAAVVFALTLVFDQNVLLDIVLMMLGVLILVHTVVSVIHFLAKSEYVTYEQIFGLINCYIIIGFIWAFSYIIIEYFIPGSFDYNEPSERYLDVFTYYSFATLTTLGYGDVIPKSVFGQRVSIAEAIVGQFYFAIIVAYILNKYSQRPGRRSAEGSKGREEGTWDPS